MLGAWVDVLSRHGLVCVAWRRAPQDKPTDVVALLLNGGEDFCLAALARFGRAADPVDCYTRHLTRRLILPGVKKLAKVERWAWAMLDTGPNSGLAREDFGALAREVGLDARSRLGLLLHPDFGPWWAMRLALWLQFSSAAQAEDFCQICPRPLPYEHACVGCAAPCVAACLGDADAGSDLGACLGHVRGGGCRDICRARAACIAGVNAGVEWAYGERVHQHHHGAFWRSIVSSG